MTTAALRLAPNVTAWSLYGVTLNSLATAAWKVGGAVDNSLRYPGIRWMLILGSWTPTTGGTIDLYQIPGVLDTGVSPTIQFNEGSDSVATQETWLTWRFRLRAAAAAQTLISPLIKAERYALWQIMNRSGATLAASGCAAYYRFEDESMET